MPYTERMIRVIPLFILILLSAPPAQAGEQGVSAGQLKAYCTGQYDVDAGFCAGYVTAIADLMKQQTLAGYTVCNLGPVGSQQLMELVQIQMQEQGGDPAQNATTMAAETFARFYPCR